MKEPPISLFVGPDGSISYLYTEKLDMRALADKEKIEIRRASDVEYNHETQKWEARLNDGTLIASDPLRSKTIDGERVYIDNLLAQGKEVPL